MTAIAGCTAATCISSGVVSILFGIVCGCFALGYGIGQSVLWTRRIGEVA